MENIADYLTTLKGVASALAQLPRERKPLIEKAVEKFVANVQTDAVQNLARPNWKLSRSIGQKTKTFESREGSGVSAQKVWGMVGFTYQDRASKRDPGFYGKFHEGGVKNSKSGRNMKAKQFLKKAKTANIDALYKELERIRQETLKKVVENVNK